MSRFLDPFGLIDATNDKIHAETGGMPPGGLVLMAIVIAAHVIAALIVLGLLASAVESLRSRKGGA